MDTCADCRRPFGNVPAAPMFTDAAWAKLARKDELLCAMCSLDRQKERGLHFGLADLMPCPFNLFHRPMSWFDMFSKGESAEAVKAWLAAAQAPPPHHRKADRR